MQGESYIERKSHTALSHRQYLTLAVPLIISGLSTPLLGAVDTAVVGRMSDPVHIGSVAIGTLIFNTMYWLLGFLRVSTTGFTSQAQGANNELETFLSFLRPMGLALIFGAIFIIFQYPILQVALYFIGVGKEIGSLASTYFSIRIWGAPFTLLNYVMIGWLIGIGKVRLSLAIQVIMNGLNIILDITFVIWLGFGIAGVAYATLISEVSAVLFGLLIIFRTMKSRGYKINIKKLVEPAPLLSMLIVNRDLFLRTICLLTMTTVFTAKGASLGDIILAANAILLQIHYMMAYLLGGFSNASSILIGKAIGSREPALYKRVHSLSAQWGLITAIGLSISIMLFGKELVSFFTTSIEVRETTLTYLGWMIVFPLVGFWGLQLEGIFSGATRARFIRDAIFFALILFSLTIWLALPYLDNHGVWLAFILFSLGRSLFLWLYVPTLNRLTLS